MTSMKVVVQIGSSGFPWMCLRRIRASFQPLLLLTLFRDSRRLYSLLASAAICINFKVYGECHDLGGRVLKHYFGLAVNIYSIRVSHQLKQICGDYIR